MFLFCMDLNTLSKNCDSVHITLDREKNIKMPNWQPLFCSFVLNMYFLIVKATKTVALSTHEVALSTLTH